LIKIENIFKFPENLNNSQSEFFKDLFSNENFRIEKIYSSGQSTPPDEWLEEDVNEFVFLVEGSASLRIKNNDEFIVLKKGDYFIIPKKTKHRVESTAPDVITTWLTIHFK
jgi:cupin 2 domain-containing protein